MVQHFRPYKVTKYTFYLRVNCLTLARIRGSQLLNSKEMGFEMINCEIARLKSPYFLLPCSDTKAIEEGSPIEIKGKSIQNCFNSNDAQKNDLKILDPDNSDSLLIDWRFYSIRFCTAKSIFNWRNSIEAIENIFKLEGDDYKWYDHQKLSNFYFW